MDQVRRHSSLCAATVCRCNGCFAVWSDVVGSLRAWDNLRRKRVEAGEILRIGGHEASVDWYGLAVQSDFGAWCAGCVDLVMG